MKRKKTLQSFFLSAMFGSLIHCGVPIASTDLSTLEKELQCVVEEAWQTNAEIPLDTILSFNLNEALVLGRDEDGLILRQISATGDESFVRIEEPLYGDLRPEAVVRMDEQNVIVAVSGSHRSRILFFKINLATGERIFLQQDPQFSQISQTIFVSLYQTNQEVRVGGFVPGEQGVLLGRIHADRVIVEQQGSFQAIANPSITPDQDGWIVASIVAGETQNELAICAGYAGERLETYEPVGENISNLAVSRDGNNALISWTERRNEQNYLVTADVHLSDLSLQTVERELLESDDFIQPVFANNEAVLVATGQTIRAVRSQTGGVFKTVIRGAELGRQWVQDGDTPLIAWMTHGLNPTTLHIGRLVCGEDTVE